MSKDKTFRHSDPKDAAAREFPALPQKKKTPLPNCLLQTLTTTFCSSRTRAGYFSLKFTICPRVQEFQKVLLLLIFWIYCLRKKSFPFCLLRNTKTKRRI